VQHNNLNASNDLLTAKRALRYEWFWGRKPDWILHPTEPIHPHIDIYRFPPVETKWFFQKWFKPVSHQYVYISGGMSDVEMPGGKSEKADLFRVELTAFSNEVYKNKSGDMDMISWWLSFLAYMPFRIKNNNFFFAPGHTISAGEPIIPGSEMTDFFFGITPSVEIKRLCSASINAQLMLQVVPISESERKLAQQKGTENLISYFEENGIEPVFDLKRKPFV
jgi:hypothetical protein